MRVGSLFSGAGLLDIGLAQAGVGHEWFVEKEPWRREHLAKRWPGIPVHDDVRTVGAHNLEPVDCIAGGFPCKGASTAGKRTGLAHPETALWAEFHRIVGELRPRYVVIENVANILALHDGAVWGTVLGDLAALGFDLAWDCVPAAAFGAPHGRDRVVAIARHAAGERREPSEYAPQQSGLLGHVGAEHREAVAHAAHLGPERLGRAWPGRDGLADGGQAAADAGRARRREDARGAHGDEAPDGRRRAEDDHEPLGAGQGWVSTAVEWGDYEPAIRRWEAVHGPAPEPLVRRLDARDAKLQRVRSRVDRQRLSALGDGVQVQLGRLIGDALNELERGDLNGR